MSLHLGHDCWWQQNKVVLPLHHVSESEVSSLSLGAHTLHHGAYTLYTP